MFAAKKPFAQVAESDREAEPGESPAQLDVDVFRNILRLVLFANVRAPDPGHKVCGEFALGPASFEFSPRPLLLDQFGLLPEERFLLVELAVRKSVGNHDVKLVVLHPLPEFSVGKLLSIEAAQARVSVGRAFWLG